MATETKTTKLYNINDGFTGRDGGPYMDQVDAEQAEIVRAKIEGREPDLENPPATAGQVLVTESQLLAGGAIIPASKQNTEVSFDAEPVAEVEVPVVDPISPIDGKPHDKGEDGDKEEDSEFTFQQPAEAQGFNDNN